MNYIHQAAIKEYKDTHATFVPEEFILWLEKQQAGGKYWEFH